VTVETAYISISPGCRIAIMADDVGAIASGVVWRQRLGGIVAVASASLVVIGPAPAVIQLGDAGDVVTHLRLGLEAGETSKDNVRLGVEMGRTSGVDDRIFMPLRRTIRIGVTATTQGVGCIVLNRDSVVMASLAADGVGSRAIAVGGIGAAGCARPGRVGGH